MVRVSALLVGLRSKASLSTRDSNCNCPTLVAVRVKVSVAPAPTARLPIGQSPVIESNVPLVATALTMLTSPGSAFVTTALVTACGPRLVTDSVTTKLLPTTALPGTVLLNCKSALGRSNCK